jgi:hypothetical protein
MKRSPTVGQGRNFVEIIYFNPFKFHFTGILDLPVPVSFPPAPG